MLVEEPLDPEGLLALARDFSDGLSPAVVQSRGVLFSRGGWVLCEDGLLFDPEHFDRCVGVDARLTREWYTSTALQRDALGDRILAARALALAVQLATDPARLDKIAGNNLR